MIVSNDIYYLLHDGRYMQNTHTFSGRYIVIILKFDHLQNVVAKA